MLLLVWCSVFLGNVVLLLFLSWTCVAVVGVAVVVVFWFIGCSFGVAVVVAVVVVVVVFWYCYFFVVLVSVWLMLLICCLSLLVVVERCCCND